MQHITTLTSSPNQRCQLVLDNNETVDFRLYYSARMQAWYYDFTYKDLTVNCSKVVLSPNSVSAFKRLIPFGLAFTSEGDTDPFEPDSFSSGKVNLYVLNAQEVELAEKNLILTNLQDL